MKDWEYLINNSERTFYDTNLKYTIGFKILKSNLYKVYISKENREHILLVTGYQWKAYMLTKWLERKEDLVIKYTDQYTEAINTVNIAIDCLTVLTNPTVDYLSINE